MVAFSRHVIKSQEPIHQAIRREFPLLEADANGRRRVFLENAAGSLVLERAVEAEIKARRNYFPNVGEPSWESKRNEEVIFEGRKAVAEFMNAPSADCIVSGESATSLLFQLSYALSREFSGTENIVTTEYEHYANLSPWMELERRGAVKEVRFARFNPEDGLLDISHLESLLDSRTIVVALTGVSNALGSKTPLKHVFDRSREWGAYTVLDAVHMAPHVPIDVQELGCDFAVFSAYKLFSRRGSFMFGREELLQKLRPYKVEPSSNMPPTKWELGTRDQALFASIASVMDYLSWLGGEVETLVSESIGRYGGRIRNLKAALYWIEQYEEGLSRVVLEGSSNVEGVGVMPRVEIYGLKDPSRVHLRSPTFSFNIKGADPERVAEYLWDRHSIVVLADDFYSRAFKTYGVRKAVRASFVHYNTIEHAERLLLAIADAAKRF